MLSSIIRYPSTVISQLRLFSSTHSIAKQLYKKYPQQDPRAIKESKVATLLKELGPDATNSTTDLASLHSAWKSIYDKSLHESAYEEMADPGEQCDGELPSWTRDRLRSEKDKDFQAPQVSAHEAKVRAIQNKTLKSS
jgi:Fe-S-cluster formation regulator IscX/YfhJ